MESPPLPMDVGDINVCLLSAKKKRSASSPSLRELDQMSLCSFPSSMSVADELSSLGERPSSSSRKRKLDDDYDTQSVLDFSMKEPSSKRARRPLSKVSLFGNRFKDSPLMQAKKSLKRSFSFSRENPSPARKYRIPGTPKEKSIVRRRSSKRSKVEKQHLPSNWVDVIGPDVGEKFSKEQIKRQEAIYSIIRTESELVEDLKMIINIFYHPLLRLRLITEEEHCKIFGNIQTILALHEEMFSKFEELRSQSDSVDSIGQLLLDWSLTLSGPYSQYCANLVVAKQTLETKRQEPAFEDFLQRCLQSDFSRKIDLWTFLDSPRTRIMKYPILLKEVKKKTARDHQDQELLEQAVSSFDGVIKNIDHCAGVAKCRDIINRLDYLHDDQRCPAIDESQFILCSGVLKNKNNSKLHVFLLDKALVLTRPSSRTGTLLYQVWRQPIPMSSLLVESLADGDGRVGGSFRGTRGLKTTANTGGKHQFKVSCSDPTVTSHAHTLQANGDYDKKAWLDAFKTVVTVTCNSSHVTVV
ncbi:neuroepithelial cell-transforming gene 1 protein-like [Halichondria panicea]|uniref:neuroepithelial cell-transforming gene 1 protein-like n=1 Tax=Halichondria panicea TaxID=6063 RepID=UPI00312B3BFE